MNLGQLKNAVSWEWLNERYLAENYDNVSSVERDDTYYLNLCEWVKRNFKRLFKTQENFNSFIQSIFYNAPIERLYKSIFFKMAINTVIFKELENIHKDLNKMEFLWKFYDIPDVMFDAYEDMFKDTYMNPKYPDFMRFWESYSYTQHVPGRIFKRFLNEFMSNKKIIKNLFLHSKYSSKLIEELDLNTNRILYNRIIGIYRS